MSTSISKGIFEGEQVTVIIRDKDGNKFAYRFGGNGKTVRVEAAYNAGFDEAYHDSFYPVMQHIARRDATFKISY